MPKRRVITFQGRPAPVYNNLQKIVEWIKRKNVQARPDIPEAIKIVSADPVAAKRTDIVFQGKVAWQTM